MKRDMDLIRELLLRLEAKPTNYGDVFLIELGDSEFAIEGRSDQEVMYHLELLRDGGLIDCPGSQPMMGVTFSGLTWKGHDFVDSVRDSEVWRMTKEGARKAGGLSVDLLLALAKGYLKTLIAKQTGIELAL